MNSLLWGPFHKQYKRWPTTGEKFIALFIWVLLMAVPVMAYMGITGQLFAEPTPQEIAAKQAEELRDAVQARKRAQETERLFILTEAQRILETQLKDPESVSYEVKGWNLSNGALCFKYRARNGFGGMAMGYLAIHQNQAYETATQFRKLCPATDNIESYTL